MISSRDARTAVRMMSLEAPLMSWLPDPDFDLGRKAYAKRLDFSGAELRHLDPDRNTLHDLREVAHRIVGRQERERRAGGRTDALDDALEVFFGDRVHFDVGFHPGRERS